MRARQVIHSTNRTSFALNQFRLIALMFVDEMWSFKIYIWGKIYVGQVDQRLPRYPDIFTSYQIQFDPRFWAPHWVQMFFKIDWISFFYLPKFYQSLCISYNGWFLQSLQQLRLSLRFYIIHSSLDFYSFTNLEFIRCALYCPSKGFSILHNPQWSLTAKLSDLCQV